MAKQILIEDISGSRNSVHEVDSLLRLNAIPKPSEKLGPLLSDIHFRAIAPTTKEHTKNDKASRPKRPRWRLK